MNVALDVEKIENHWFKSFITKKILQEIWGFHSGEDDDVLDFSAV
jgi:hypothetical protein